MPISVSYPSLELCIKPFTSHLADDNVISRNKRFRVSLPISSRIYSGFNRPVFMLFMALIAHIKTLITLVFGSLKDAFRRLLFSPDDCDHNISSSNLESGMLSNQAYRIPSTTLIQMFFETLFGSRCLTSSSKYAYDGLVMPHPTAKSIFPDTLFVDLLSLKMEHRMKMTLTGQRYVPLSSGNTRPKDRTRMTGQQLGRYTSPPESNGDNFRKWTLVMRTLIASRSVLEGGFTPKYPPALSHVRGYRPHHTSSLPSRIRSLPSFPFVEPDMARNPSLKSRIPRPKPGVRRHVRSMDRNVVYRFGKMPLPVPFPTPVPHPPAPPSSPARYRSVSDTLRLRGFHGATNHSVLYPLIRLPERGL